MSENKNITNNDEIIENVLNLKNSTEIFKNPNIELNNMTDIKIDIEKIKKNICVIEFFNEDKTQIKSEILPIQNYILKSVNNYNLENKNITSLIDGANDNSFELINNQGICIFLIFSSLIYEKKETENGIGLYFKLDIEEELRDSEINQFNNIINESSQLSYSDRSIKTKYINIFNAHLENKIKKKNSNK